MTARLSLVERFNAKVNKNGPIHPVLGTRCHLWTGAPRNGYGVIRLGEGHGERIEYAHRVSWTINVGPIPPGLRVLHHCDVHLCVNYETHLFTGTAADNTADMVAKGRARGWPKGVPNTRGPNRPKEMF